MKEAIDKIKVSALQWRDGPTMLRPFLSRDIHVIFLFLLIYPTFLSVYRETNQLALR